ncbi:MULTISPECIES: hypothetical protein [unclassified Streptomyces]|uniref:hypothetical protein n=1 Tax=unclassified Streptomyces TaxID=2593676 RepID=UPI0037FAE0A3
MVEQTDVLLSDSLVFERIDEVEVEAVTGAFGTVEVWREVAWSRRSVRTAAASRAGSTIVTSAGWRTFRWLMGHTSADCTLHAHHLHVAGVGRTGERNRFTKPDRRTTRVGLGGQGIAAPDQAIIHER